MSEISVPMVSHAGVEGNALLQWCASVLDATRLGSWDAQGGNCFYASTDAMFMLLPAIADVEGGLTSTFLTTGRFDHLDTPDPVFHCWIEFKTGRGTLVLNVSNLSASRPIYASWKADYRNLNRCRKTLQRIPASEVLERYGAGEKDGDEVRAIVKELLGPTLKRVPR